MKFILFLISFSLFGAIAHGESSCQATISCTTASVTCAESGAHAECGIAHRKYLSCQDEQMNPEYICCTATGTAFKTHLKMNADLRCDNTGTVR